MRVAKHKILDKFLMRGLYIAKIVRVAKPSRHYIKVLKSLYIAKIVRVAKRKLSIA